MSLAFKLQSRTLATTTRASGTSASLLKEFRASWTVQAPTEFSGFIRRPHILSEVSYSRRRRSTLATTGTVSPAFHIRSIMSSTTSISEQRTETNTSSPLTLREEDSKDNASLLVNQTQLPRRVIEVDVIVPVHNACETIVSTVESAMAQIIPDELDFFTKTDIPPPVLSIHVCCYDDGSTDDSWKLLTQLLQQQQHVVDEVSTTATPEKAQSTASRRIPITLHIFQSVDGVARGAGYARNRAVEMRSNQLHTNDSSTSSNEDQQSQPAPVAVTDRFLCMLDSDDVMHPTRVAHQVAHLLSLPEQERQHTLLGCTFDRDPPDATWHYAQWANGLTYASLIHEQYRELTLLQPTWMLTRSRFESLQGYMEAPPPNDTRTLQEYLRDQNYNDNDNDNASSPTITNSNQNNNGDGVGDGDDNNQVLHLVHADFETLATLRVAEDLRFFHKHLADEGLLQLVRTVTPLLTYRHRAGQSQSSQTPRRLLLYLRARALERRVLQTDPKWQQFCVWGAGRDGKDFVKALSPETRRRVYCMVDVDDKKIDRGYYVNRDIDVKIPIVHYSLLATDPAVRLELQRAFERSTVDDLNEPGFGKIDKSKPSKASLSAADGNGNHEQEAAPPPRKKRRLHTTAPGVLNLAILPELPVVVCVAMYRTNGALEHNVKSIGRTEGKDLWHFS
jgi:glycosyltransferase involved in cell wall biosynthesis